MTDHRPLNATAASLLGFLHDGPMTGYELAAMAQRVIGDFWSLTQSQVYRELAWMAEAGLVTAGERGHGTVDHMPANPGRVAFAEWVMRPPGAETIRHPLLLAISFGAIPTGPPGRVHPPASRGARGAPPHLPDAGGSGKHRLERRA